MLGRNVEGQRFEVNDWPSGASCLLVSNPSRGGTEGAECD